MNDHIPQSYHTLPPGTVLHTTTSLNGFQEKADSESPIAANSAIQTNILRSKSISKSYRIPKDRTRKLHCCSLSGRHQELFERERRRFLTEASILQEFQQLEHIVGVKDIIEANGTFYLVMKLIDGLTLKQYIKENEPLSFDELFQLIAPVLRIVFRFIKRITSWRHQSGQSDSRNRQSIPPH